MKSTKKGKTITEFEQAFGAPKIARLERELANQKAKVENLAGKHKKVNVLKQASNIVRFALTGDRHIGSLEFFEDGLHAFYNRVRAEGIDLVLDAGDVLDGNRMYRGQEFELRDVGFAAQLTRFVNTMPRIAGIKTEFITGNHDASFKSAAGIGVGESLAEKRDDYVFLGEAQATKRFVTPAGVFDVMLLHPDGGTSYALSYRPQKITEQLEGGTKPNLIGIGHYHKAEFIPSYRNVAVCQTGTFSWQTPYMMRKGLSAHVGGWLFEVTVGESWNSIKAEFVAFYR
jgi:hypothetical protein